MLETHCSASFSSHFDPFSDIQPLVVGNADIVTFALSQTYARQVAFEAAAGARRRRATNDFSLALSFRMSQDGDTHLLFASSPSSQLNMTV